jgi:hypothetical protein
MSQKTEKLTIRNWITALRKTPKFKVTAPAFLGLGQRRLRGSLQRDKDVGEVDATDEEPDDRGEHVLHQAVHHGGESKPDEYAYREVHDIAAHDESVELSDLGRPANTDR